jgi:RNA polymerase sigma-70 factor, ECF subfamily
LPSAGEQISEVERNCALTDAPRRSMVDDMNVLTDNSSIEFGPEERRFVYAVARRIVQDDDDAEDVAQDALLLAHRNLASFRGESRFRTWLYRIATTTALGHLRRSKRARFHVPVSELQLVDPGKSAEQTVADAEVDELVRDAVAELEPPYRDVLLARADASEAEAAERLGITVANVKVRAHRARNQLRGVLQQALDAPLPLAA